MESVAKPLAHELIGTELVRDWIPVDEPRATFVLVHGLAEHSGRYERTGSLLSDAGFHVRSFDLIGAGASGGDRWDIDDWGRYHDQIRTHVEWAREQRQPVVLMGHSLGGNLVLGYVTGDRPPPDLVVVSAPALGGERSGRRLSLRSSPRSPQLCPCPTISTVSTFRAIQLSQRHISPTPLFTSSQRPDSVHPFSRPWTT